MGIPYGILAAAALTVWKMPVCVERGNDHQLVVERAQVMAAAILKKIGLSVEWRDYAACKVELDAAIRVTLVVQRNDEDHPGALAYAHAFEGRHIRVLYDRVLKMGPDRVVAVLAYVLVHEITHLLQGTDFHSDTGIMKRRWNSSDFAQMERGTLFFTDADVLLIHLGRKAFGSGELRSEPATGEVPVALQCGDGNTERVGGFGFGQPPEKAHFDDLGGARIEFLQP